MKKPLTALLCAALMLTLVPQTAKAVEEDYTYVDENGDTQTTAGLIVTPVTAETATLTGGWHVVDGNVTVASTITVSGEVTLLLMDGFTLTVTGSADNAGINVSPGNSLTVYGQAGGTGTLYAQGGTNGAGIGGRKSQNGGSITINSGIVTARGGDYGAGIGGGRGNGYPNNGDGGTINIYGGKVTASSPNRAAGIGGGYCGNGGIISIFGGEVAEATGGDNGAGIGGGMLGNGGTITISDGVVNATGGTDSAGIGGGYGGSSANNYGNGGTITIFGGTVTASGNGDGAGIGGGMFGTGGTIKISGGDVKATSSGGAGIGGGAVKDGGSITILGGKLEASSYDGAGIGGGAHGSGGNIIISGGEVRATGTYRSAGIGGGVMGSGGTTTIENGTVIANGGDQGGAGIGGGDLASANDIKILNGDVTARGGVWGAGIGGGGAGLYAGQPRGSGGNITISGGTIKAYGGGFAAGIGAGGTNTANPHNGGIIQILGGKVTARGGSSGMDAGLDIGRGRNGINGTVLLDSTARVELASNGIDTSVTTIGTCIIKGSASGGLLGAYENGAKLEGTLIDLSSPTLSSGTGYTVSGNSVTLTGANPCILSDSTAARNIVVTSGVNADVVLFTADIAPASGCAFDMTGATVSLKLVGANSLKSSGIYAGLQVPDGAQLQVTGSGSLVAEGGSNGAGIGGRSGSGAGSITISGGEVTALGNGGGAGIGGGNGGAGGIVLAEGADTVVSTTGGINGYDIGSGNGSGAGGSLTVNNNATVLLNRNGTNATASYISCTVGGEGAGLKAGTYVDSCKLLTYGDVGILPGLGAKALDTVTLSVVVDGLSDIEPEGYMSFQANGVEIGQSLFTRTGTGSAQGTAVFDWAAPGGTYTITAQYVQNEVMDSYITAGSVQITTGYTVSRVEQAPLTVGDPGRVTYADAPFNLLISGGSGTGDMGFSVTSGDAVSVNASGRVTINKAGTVTVTVVKAADGNYEEAEATITITVNKATPASVVFPAASAVTYGARLSSSVLSGGSGDGGFAWENPDTVPTVDNSGYNVIFTPRDADNYDYSGFTLEDIVAISVSKALPAVTFPTASSITYGESLSSSTLSGGSGDGSFAWKNPDTVPHVINSGYTVVFTPGDAENYQTVEQIVSISVNKADQAPLSVHVPGAIRYGYADFTLDVSGGSGTGALSYAVISGDSVAVDASGRVRVLNLGISVLTITKAGDDLYNETSVSVEIRVKANATSGAAATRSPTSHPTASPSAGALPAPSNNVVFTPSVSASPALVIDVLPATPASPSPSGALPAPLTDAIPAPYEETAVLMPINMEENSETGRIMVEVSITDLPEDTTAIRLASGKVIYIDHTQETLQLEVGRDDLNTQGELEILALHEQIPLALYKIAVVCAHDQVSAADSKIHVLIWIAGGIVLAGLAGAIIVIRQKKYKQRV